MATIAYFNGVFGDYDKLTIPFGDRSIFYGDAVYDAVLVLDRKCFALDKHLDRLYRSCKLTDIEFTMDRDELKKEIEKLLNMADMGQVMLYLQVSRGCAPRKHEYPENATPNLLMYAAPTKVPPIDKKASLMKFEDLRFQYCNIKTTNLMPNVFAAQKATAGGKTEVLFHRGDRVTEAAHSSILIIKDGKVIMPPLDSLILPGITRQILTEICVENSIPVENRIFTIDELMDADEIILCSTTKNVIYVYDVDGTPVGGKDRVLGERLQKLFLDKVFIDTGVKLY